jgi:hypothetical protein
VSIGTWLPHAAAKLPDLTVRLDGQEQTFAAARYDKDGTPRFSDGTVYRLGVKKDDAKPRPRTFKLDP